MKLTAVPGHLVVALCVVSFLLGSIFTGSPPAPALDPAASGAINLANGGRKLAAAGAIDAKASRIAKAKRTSLLEAGELESLLINGSGLIEVRHVLLSCVLLHAVAAFYCFTTVFACSTTRCLFFVHVSTLIKLHNQTRCVAPHCRTLRRLCRLPPAAIHSSAFICL